jgi:cadmium resistance protein CadD (predicted permease)
MRFLKVVLLFFLSFSFAAKQPNINEILEKYKYKNFYFQLILQDKIAKQCKDYTYQIDDM